MTKIRLEVELFDKISLLSNESRSWNGVVDGEHVEITLESVEEVHGFGVSEIVIISVSVTTSVAANLLTDALKLAVGTAIRRVRSDMGTADGSDAEIASLLSAEVVCVPVKSDGVETQ